MRVLLCTIVLTLIAEANSRGVLYIQFVKYENNDGLGANGECCDGKWGICQRNGCDHMFTLCLDRTGRENDMNGCIYGKIYSRAIKDQNVITFTNTIANLTNPIPITFLSAIPHDMALKVDVWDHDKGFGTGGDDHVDTLAQRLTFNSRTTEYVTRHRTRLIFKTRIECMSNYYGIRCDNYCEPPTPTSHYSCNLENGNKICAAGWEGPNCDRQIQRPCDTRPCLNGGSCVGQGQSGRCQCPSSFTGERCEIPERQQELDPCDSVFCRNGGACISLSSTTGHCVCLNGYTGTNCEIAIRATTTTTTEGPSTIPQMQSGDIDCDALAKAGFMYMDGVYNIQPRGATQSFQVYCDMTTVGWTIIQRHSAGNANFNQNWNRYKEGFGELGDSGDFWLGLEKIHQITNQNPYKYKLKIKFKTFDSRWHYAEYSRFWIDGETDNYRLHVSGYSGNAGDALNSQAQGGRHMQNGMSFSTSDRDNDNASYNCAQRQQSGWWYNACGEANLNAPMVEVSPRHHSCGDMPCMTWASHTEYQGTPLLSATMMILPN